LVTYSSGHGRTYAIMKMLQPLETAFFDENKVSRKCLVCRWVSK
jgi:hypothetical protein